MRLMHVVVATAVSLALGTSWAWSQCGMGGHGSHQGHKSHEQETTSDDPAMPIAAYPLTYCLVSGEPLGSMGEPVIRAYNSRQIKFCSNGCTAKFEADQEGYLKQLDKTIIASQLEAYPLSKCVVTGNTLGEMGEPYDYVYDNTLVRFCCAGCVTKFEQTPEKFLKKLDKAAGRKASSRQLKPASSDASSGDPGSHRH